MAGAAVGVSHLVQSTRAGAEYGWLPVVAIVFIHMAKYPFFIAGPRYALATGRSLVQAYRDLGIWALGLFIAFTLCTMWATIAAIVAVTTGIAMYIFGIDWPPAYAAGVIMALCASLLLYGKYRVLDRIVRYVVVLLSVATLAAFLLALNSDRPLPTGQAALVWDAALLLILVKLMGWMPAPLDLSVWHSIWALEKRGDTDQSFDGRRGRIDFHTGYWGTMVLGILFLGLGVLFYHRSGLHVPEGGVDFSRSLLQVYTTQLGGWAFAVVAVAALATMLSTTLTVMDAIPRSLAEAYSALKPDAGRALYPAFLVLLVAGAFGLMTLWAPSMMRMVDLAAVLSFCITPVLAFLNYKVMTRRDLPPGVAFNTLERLWAVAALAALLALTGLFLYLMF